MRTLAFLVLLAVAIHTTAQNANQIYAPADIDSARILTPPPGPAPRINSPTVFGVRPGHPIVYTIPATGTRPIEFSMTGLPAGVHFDKNTGRFSGSISTPGEYLLTLHARNKAGRTEKRFRLIVGEKIALTPPMGWNSWNIYASKITQELVAANARAMATSGLIDHG